jgi:hypothetical protein
MEKKTFRYCVYLSLKTDVFLYLTVEFLYVQLVWKWHSGSGKGIIENVEILKTHCQKIIEVSARVIQRFRSQCKYIKLLQNDENSDDTSICQESNGWQYRNGQALYKYIHLYSKLKLGFKSTIESRTVGKFSERHLL